VEEQVRSGRVVARRRAGGGEAKVGGQVGRGRGAGRAGDDQVQQPGEEQEPPADGHGGSDGGC